MRVAVTTSQRLGVTITVALCAWSSTALAAITMNPGTIDAGSAAVGGTSPGGTGMLSSSRDDRVDLVVSNSCSGTGAGTFTLNPSSNIDLRGGTVATITVNYSPTARGTLTCLVDVFNRGTFQVLGTFMV